MDKYFPTSFWWSLSVLLPYWEEIYSLVMGSFSAPKALQLLVTTKESITPSIERGQKLWEDKINPQVWDQGFLGEPTKLNPSSLSSEIPLGFLTGNNMLSKERLETD